MISATFAYLIILFFLFFHIFFYFSFQACFPDSDTAKLESHIFRMYDKNGDGHIDFREFMIVLYVMSNGTPEENLKQVSLN